MNVHRRFLDDEALRALLGRLGVPSAPARAELIDGGTYNSVYRLSFDDRAGAVLKVSPTPDGAAMTYESGLIATEAAFYSLAAPAGVPVPRVLGTADLTDDLGGGEALLVSELPGRPWSRLAPAFDDESRLRHDLGRLVAALHTVRGPAFGYPSGSTGPMTASWREAFTAMTLAVVNDARRFGAALPVRPERVLDLITACAGDLDSVRVPRLVHFDLWAGNVLVDTAADAGPRISGIVDGERAMWGDPLVDLVSTALFSEIRDDADFLRGYESHGGHGVAFDPGARRRLLLYRIYLQLIMATEGIPRGVGDAPADARIAAGLVADVGELALLVEWENR